VGARGSTRTFTILYFFINSDPRFSTPASRNARQCDRAFPSSRAQARSIITLSDRILLFSFLPRPRAIVTRGEATLHGIPAARSIHRASTVRPYVTPSPPPPPVRLDLLVARGPRETRWGMIWRDRRLISYTRLDTLDALFCPLFYLRATACTRAFASERRQWDAIRQSPC